MTYLLVFLSAYLIGAIPFGYLAGKINGINVLELGSKSTGTTNVIRLLGKKWGILVLILDIGKGALAVWIAQLVLNIPLFNILAGLLAMIGHAKSVFIKFKGGKSAATGIGIILILDPRVFLITGLVVIIVRQLSGYQSLATLCASVLVPALLAVVHAPLEYVVFTFLGVAFVWWKHIPNIQRLLQGKESKITKGVTK